MISLTRLNTLKMTAQCVNMTHLKMRTLRKVCKVLFVSYTHINLQYLKSNKNTI